MPPMKLGRSLKHLPIEARVVKLVNTADLESAGKSERLPCEFESRHGNTLLSMIIKDRFIFRLDRDSSAACLRRP